MYYKNLYPVKNSFVPLVFDAVDQFLGRDFHHLIGADFINQTPLVNITETPENYLIEVAAAGLQKNDFKIELDKNQLIVSVEKQQEALPEGQRFVRREFAYTNFKRAFRLAQNVDKEAINAKYENGILQIAIPKKTEVSAEAKTITIS